LKMDISNTMIADIRIHRSLSFIYVWGLK